MDELLAIAESSSPLPINKINKWISKKIIEISKQSSDQISTYISQLFDFINKKSIGFSQKDWDRIRFLIIVAMLSLYPNPSDLRSLPIKTEDGKLFNILLALHTFKNDHNNFVDQYLDAFSQGLKSINDSQPKTFYSISKLYYLQSLPSLFKLTLTKDQFIDQLTHLSKEITQLTPDKLNINLLTLLTDIFIQSIYFLKSINDPETMKNVLRYFIQILDLCSICPTILLLNILHPWFKFIEFCKDPKNQPFDLNVSDHVEMFSRLYESAASFKNHELHRSFPWFIAFVFYGLTKTRDQKSRCLSLICHAFESVPHLESLREIPEATKKIHKIMLRQIPTEGKWPIYHIITSLEMSIRVGISDLKTIHGITIDRNLKPQETVTRHVKFIDQIFEEEIFKDIDDNLSTVIEEIAFHDYESAKKEFDRQIQLLSSIGTRLKTEIQFQYLFIDSILDSLKSPDSNLLSTSYFYVSNLITLGIKLIIISSHRITMLELFNHNEILTNFRDPSKPTTYIEEISSFSLIAQRYIEFIERIPDKFYPNLASEISMILFHAYRKRQLTYTAIKYLTYLRPEYLKNDRQHEETLYSYLLCKLFDITSSYLDYFLSNRSSKSLFLYQWILFIFRLGMIDPNECHPCLKRHTKTLYKLFFATIIIHGNKISNQTFSIRLLSTYFRTAEEELSQSYPKALPNILDDIQPYAKKDALEPILKIMVHELDLMNIHKNFDLLTLSLNSDDYSIIKRASDFCLAFFKNPNSTKMPELFNTLLRKLTKLPVNISHEIIQLLPKHSQEVNNCLSLENDAKLIDPISQLNVIHFLNEILYNMSDSPEEIANMFFLLKELFMIQYTTIETNGDSNQQQSLRSLLLTLCYCSNCDSIKEKVDTFSNELTTKFAQLYLERKSCLFLLCLINISGLNRSENARYAMNMVVTFFETITQCSLEIHKTFAMNMFDYFHNLNRMYPMLMGLYVFSRFVPQAISIQTIVLFLVSLSEQCIYDLDFSSIFNKTLKNYINALNYAQKVEFLSKIYNLLSKTNLVCTIILFKRLHKMGIQLDIENIESQFEDDLSISFQKISCCCACGIRNKIEFSKETKSRIAEFIQLKPENVSAPEKWFRKMSLYFALLYVPHVFEQLTTDSSFLNSYIIFLAHSLSSKIPAMHKTAMKGFKKLYRINEKQSTNQIHDFCGKPDKFFQFFYPKYERIAFYRRLMKLFPRLIPGPIVHNFISDIAKYSDSNEVDKFTYLPNAIEYVRFLTVKEYIQRPDVTQIILSKFDDNCTHLQKLIESIQKLYVQDKIPYFSTLQKYLRKFLKLFPKETIDFFILNAEQNFTDRFLVLVDMTANDEENIFFTYLINFFRINTDYNRFPPSLFCILADLSKIPRFAISEDLRNILDSILVFLMKTVSNPDTSIRGEFLFTHLTEIAYAIINTFSIKPDMRRVFSFTDIFYLSEMTNSYIYRRFVVVVFKKASQQFLDELIDYIITESPQISQKVLEILFSNALKCSTNKSPEKLEEIWKFISRNITLNSTSCISFIRYLLPNGLPKHHIDLFTALQNTISMSDSQIVLNSIKLASLLVKMKLMPDGLYNAISQQLFSYSKFFEMPFSKHTARFLNLRENKPISNELIETITYFTHDKLKTIRDIMRLITVFTSVPSYSKYLPFSLLVTFSLFLEKHLNESFDLDLVFVSVLNFIKAANPSHDEILKFTSVATRYIQLLFDQKKFKDFPELWFEYMIKSHWEEFDMKIELHENMCYSLALFSWVSQVNPNELTKKEYLPMIETILEYSKEPIQIVHDFFLRNFLDFIVKNLPEVFLPSLLKIFDFLCQHFDDTTRNRLIVFSNVIVQCSNDQLDHLNNLWIFIRSLSDSPEMNHSKSLLYTYLISSIKNMNDASHRSFFMDFLIENTLINQTYWFGFISSIPSLLFDEKLHRQSETILKTIPELFTKIMYPKVDEFLSSLTKYGNKMNRDVTFEIISILLGQCTFCSISNRLKYLQRVIKLRDKIDLKIFVSNLDLAFWSNKYLSITSSLFMLNDSPLWCPLFAFSHRFDKSSIELAKSSLQNLFSELGFDFMFGLFSKIIAGKPFKSFTNVSIAFLDIFKSKQVRIPIAMIEKMIKYWEDQTILLDFLPDQIPSEFYLYPHQLNDSIFGRFLNQLDKQEAIAISLTILGEYEQAHQFYKFDLEKPIVSAFSNVNSHFYRVDHEVFSFQNFLKPFYFINQIDDPILDRIGQIVDLCEKKELDNPFEQLFECENLLIPQIRRSKILSVFEKERLIAVEAVIQQVRKRLQNGKLLNISKEFYSSISPIFCSSLEKITNYLTGKRQLQQPKTDNSIPVVLFSPRFIDNFQIVSSITPHNFLAVSSKQIETNMVVVSQSLSQNEISFSEWTKFSEFAFSLFLLQPSHSLYEISFGIHKQILLSPHLSNQSLVKHQIIQRLLTLIRLAFSNSLIDTMSALVKKSTIFSQSYAELWQDYSMQLVDLAKFDWFGQIVSDLLAKSPYRSLIHAKNNNSKLTDFLNSKLNHTILKNMASLSNLFDSLFELDYQKVFSQFIFKTSVEQAVEFKRQSKYPNTFFEYAVNSVDFDGIQNGQSDSFDEFDKFAEIMKQLNYLIPFELPIGNTESETFRHFLKFCFDIRIISPNCLILFVVTSNSPKQPFLIQKVHDLPASLSFSLTLNNFKHLFASNYLTRIRNLFFDFKSQYEIGPRYLISLFDSNSEIHCLSSLFSSKIQMTPEKWNHNSMLPPNCLLELVTNKLTKQQFNIFRLLFVRSAAVNSVVRYIYHAPYSKLDRYWFSLGNPSVKFISSDLEYRNIFSTIKKNLDLQGTESSFRLSPNLTTLFGCGFKGEFFMSFAASFKSILDEFEWFRSTMEYLISQFAISNGQLNCDNLLKMRNRMEERIFEVAPPSGSSVNEEFSAKWFDNLIGIINQAENPEIQSPETIPWF